ncbi:hypothetical protein ANN_23320 [Periplaneta americana]|uniref:Uncharacterized protein n=1 Tax=Periplaneta americana TaxID=6978 RepID=A0ABQ8SM02_PERAM|nr:hypothetical protein ANN_23320 [Periplaneta americana]
MAGLCEGGNELAGSLKVICKRSINSRVIVRSAGLEQRMHSQELNPQRLNREAIARSRNLHGVQRYLA